MKPNRNLYNKPRKLFTAQSTHKFLVLFLFTVFIYLSFTSCDILNPSSHKGITLTKEDASCTEAWLNLKIEALTLPRKITLNQNDSTVITANINSNDTTLFVENLLPNHTYSFQANIQTANSKSNKVTVTTMDTTSHNFTWETFTFGGANGSSHLRDVAIINENDIWAVGEIHTAETDQWNADSTEWVQPYNAVHWDGNTWELKRILFPVDADQPNSYKSAKECRAIIVFNENNFLITASTQFAFMNSKGEYTIKTIGFKWEDRFTINAIWGTSSKDFYVVGNGGNIAHYNGSSWTKIESGVDADIQDIWGAEINNNTIIAYAVSNIAVVGDREILLYNNGIKQTIFWPSGLRINSIWFQSLRQMFSCGDGIYKRIGTNWERQIALENTTYTEKIRGTSLNDIFVVGDFGFVTHYNGKNWKIYNELAVGLFYSLSYKNNVVVAVGERNAKGVIITGKRL